jgi:hypothetical protein
MHRSNGSNSEHPLIRPLADGVETIWPDDSTTETGVVGDFRWFFGPKKALMGKNKLSNFTPTRSDNTLRRKKFELIVSLGRLPSNGALSSNLINIYGDRLFQLLHDKSRSIEKQKSFRKRISTTLHFADVTFSEHKRAEMQACWYVVNKIRAVQPIDLLLNTSHEELRDSNARRSFEEKVFAEVEHNLQALEMEILSRKSDGNNITANQKNVLKKQTDKIKDLRDHIQQLAKQLRDLPAEKKTQYYRNTLIQAWQRKHFQQFNEDFQDQQSFIGLQSQSVPSPKESISCSITRTDAESAVTRYTYQEQTPFTRSQLWLFSEDDQSELLCSRLYCNDAAKRKKLLMATCIVDAMTDSSQETEDPITVNSPTGSITENSHESEEPMPGKSIENIKIDRIQEDTLANARERYRKMKDQQKLASKKAKAERKDIPYSKRMQSFGQALNPFSHPIDPETGLPFASREWTRYWHGFATRFSAGRESYQSRLALALLDEDIQSITYRVPLQNSMPTTELKSSESKELAESKENKYASDVPAATPDCPHREHEFHLAPSPSPISLVKADDILNGFLEFFSEFSEFISNDLVKKRPYISALFFTIPMLQLALPTLGTRLDLMNDLAKFIITFESYFAQHVGVTAANIDEAITAINHFTNWVTCAKEGSFESILVATLVAKLLFNTADTVINGIIPNASLLSEYFDTIYPGATGSLENMTSAQQGIAVVKGLIKNVLILGANTYGVAAIQHFVPGISEFLKVLADIPLDKLVQTPTSVTQGIQLIAIAKASTIFMAKAYCTYTQMQRGQIKDRDGHHVTQESSSYQILKLFDKLVHHSTPKEREKFINSPSYAILRSHFEELLSLNPTLWENYRNEDKTFTALRQLNIHKIKPNTVAKIAMGVLKTPFTAMKVGMGILPALFVTIPYLCMSRLKNKAAHDLSSFSHFQFLYQMGLESLSTLTKVAKIAWTFGKIIPQSLGSLALRIPEVVATVPFLPVFALASVGRIFFSKAKTTAPVIALHSKIVHGIRTHFRYPIERAIDKVLTFFRNGFVRTVEREMQVPHPLNTKPITRRTGMSSVPITGSAASAENSFTEHKRTSSALDAVDSLVTEASVTITSTTTLAPSSTDTTPSLFRTLGNTSSSSPEKKKANIKTVSPELILDDDGVDQSASHSHTRAATNTVTPQSQVIASNELILSEDDERDENASSSRERTLSFSS